MDKLSAQPAFATGLESPIARLQASVQTILKGKEEVVDFVLAALFARGHLLIEDVPGVGKTTLARALAHSLGCRFHRIQFTSDLLPSDVIGVTVFNRQNDQFEFKPGPIFTNILLADEINRTTPKTQSALLEAMNESQVTVDNRTFPLPQPFMVLATQNPIEHHGTYPLPESQLDRFLLRIRMGYPDRASEKQIVKNFVRHDPFEDLKPVLSGEEISDIQNAVREVKVDDALLEYALLVAERTRRHEFLSLGVSPRGSMALYRAAQAMAMIAGRDYCIADDIKRLVLPVLAHRLVVSSRYASTQKKGFQAEALLEEIVNSLPVPL